MSDIDEIRRILALYCQYADDGRIDDFLALWHTDSTLHLSDRSATGHAEIREVVAGSPWMTTPGRVKHLVLNSAITISADGRTADATSDFVTLTAEDDGIKIGWAGRNQDRFAKRESSWLIAERRIVSRL